MQRRINDLVTVRRLGQRLTRYREMALGLRRQGASRSSSVDQNGSGASGAGRPGFGGGRGVGGSFSGGGTGRR